MKPCVKCGAALPNATEKCDACGATVRNMMVKDMNLGYERHVIGQKVFKSLGDVAPAMGMIGTLVGLVLMLSAMDSIIDKEEGKIDEGRYKDIAESVAFISVNLDKLVELDEVVEALYRGDIEVEEADQPNGSETRPKKRHKRKTLTNNKQLLPLSRRSTCMVLKRQY